MTRIRIALALLALCLCALGFLVARDGAPAKYHPQQFPDPHKATMPLLGLNGSGAGYCVTILGTDLRVEVPGHILDPVKRDEFNRRAGLVAEKLPTDPGTIILEYRASVQNAFRLAASMSGRADLIAAAEVPLQFEDLGDPEPLRGQKPPKATCMKSSCFGQPSSCVPTGCGGGCADCVGIRVPSAQ